MLERLGCMSRSRIEKRISKVVWETLSKVKHDDEELAWDGEESEDIFFIPPQSHVKGNVVSNTQSHLEMSGVIHSTIVEELKNLELAYLGSHASKYSRPKQKQQRGFKSIIKLGVKQPQPIPTSSNSSQGNKQVEGSGK